VIFHGCFVCLPEGIDHEHQVKQSTVTGCCESRLAQATGCTVVHADQRVGPLAKQFLGTSFHVLVGRWRWTGYRCKEGSPTLNFFFLQEHTNILESHHHIKIKWVLCFIWRRPVDEVPLAFGSPVWDPNPFTNAGVRFGSLCTYPLYVISMYMFVFSE
jgi:hypothetical protein